MHCSPSSKTCKLVVDSGAKLQAALAVLREAEARALTAAAYNYRNAVVSKLMQGYTTGAFSHGGAGVAGTVTIGEVQQGPNGSTIAVGTNVDYALFWELGHMNTFTRRYERVEHWRHALEESGDSMARTFGTTYTAFAGGQPAPQFSVSVGASAYLGPNPAPGFGGYHG